MALINKRKLSDTVIEEIKRMIQRGELAVGDKLPNQQEFAAQLGVSRTVLREALQTLALLGVVEQRPKLGTVIRSTVSALYADHLTPPLMADVSATVELIEARRSIEVGAVELAVDHATPEEIREMGALINDMTEALKAGDATAYTEKNIAFHFLIANASHNRFIAHLMANIRGFMEQWMQESVSVFPGLLERSAKSHRAIYQAVRDRDRRKAISATKKHILDLQNSVEAYYDITRKELSESGKTDALTLVR
ncbi:MAG: FCD domain-containing protein [Proteobacteria bacterium]|nr:FCD domain-containing protein [Pseudomonadota bacterium]